MEHRLGRSKIKWPPLISGNVAGFIALVFILPFACLFWLCPFISPWTLGNDYAMFPIQHQLELMFSIKTGSFPLFVPGFSGGQSSSALTLSQIYHPVAYLASIMPGYWEGNALEWNTFLRLVFLGLAQFYLFIFLRTIKVNTAASFILSFITVYNLRMLDLFRYGASLESWTGLIYLFSSIGYYYLRPTPIIGRLLIICSTYWLVCSGHPQMMYYALCGIALFVLILPKFVAVLTKVDPDPNLTIWRFWINVTVSVLAGIALTAAYTAPFYFDFLADNAGRVGSDYNFAVTFVDTVSGTINNFFQPLRSDVHSAFGGSSLFLLAILVPLLWFFRIKIPGSIWCIWVVALLIFLHMQGPRTFVHYVAWKYLPLASSIRIPGRLSLLLPLIFLLLLIWILQKEDSSFLIAGKRIKLSPKEILSVLSIMVIGIYLLLPEALNNHPTLYSPSSIRDIPQWLEPFAIITGLSGLSVFAIYNKYGFSTPYGAALFSLLLGMQVVCLLTYGTWTITKSDTDQFSTLLNHKKTKLDYKHLPGSGLYSRTVMEHVKKTNLEPLLAKFYKNAIAAKDSEDAYRLIGMDRRPNQVIIEDCPDCVIRNSMSLKSEIAPDRIQLVYSSYNRLEFEVDISTEGFIGLAYPYSGHWRAFVNGNKVHVYRANGAAHAVKVPQGTSRVEFRYWSTASVWGMLITCFSIVLIVIFLSIVSLKKPYNIIGVFFAIVCGTGLFTLWYHSLYNGQNIGTEYVWTSSPNSGPVNLAYGKPTRTSIILKETYPDYFYSDPYLTFFTSGKAVDGNRIMGSGFVSNVEEKPYWYVDLQEPRDIGSLALYENTLKQKWNQRPLLVGLSNNGKKWRTASVITNKDRTNKIVLKFNPTENARYVIVQSPKFGRLAFDEVEIYPPSYED